MSNQAKRRLIHSFGLWLVLVETNVGHALLFVLFRFLQKNGNILCMLQRKNTDLLSAGAAQYDCFTWVASSLTRL